MSLPNSSVGVHTLEVIPDPVSLMESMRAVGYTTETAIADLIDNSISAEADLIDVQYDAIDSPFVAILDNGTGMNGDELTSAMRHGSRNPADLRQPGDLGRFGLGLKTASLSQCRRLTVISKQAGNISARRWDLDVVQDSGRWLVVVPDDSELFEFAMFKLLQKLDSGTLVVWQDLDRLAAGATDLASEMTAKLAGLFDHLALVFHRFTQKEDGFKSVSIRVNGLPLPERDPFLRKNTFRQPLEGQTIKHVRGIVKVTPYVLPPISHLSPDEIELAGGREGLRGTQGFYVYRNRRLVIWGTWFRLVPKQEFFKLTRVQVDIPNSFDDLWALDIKKSAAHPPDVIRTRLKELIPHFANVSRRTVTYPGRKTGSKDFVPFWLRMEPRHGYFRYELNIEHPAIQAFASALDDGGRRQFEMLLGLATDSLPVEGIYADMCADTKHQDDEATFAGLVEIAGNLMEITGLPIDQVLFIDPLIRHLGQHERLKQEFDK